MILPWIPIVPVIAALVSAWSARPLVARLATSVSAVVVFVLTLMVAATVDGAGRMVLLTHWVGVDGLSALILVLQGFVGMTALLYSWDYIRHLARGHPDRECRYYMNLNLFVASLLLVPLLLQPALTWVAVELTTVLSVFLVSFDNTPQALEAAWKYAVITIMGATVAVLGIFLLLWGLTSAGDSVQTWSALVLAAPHMPAAQLKLAFVLILLGFGTKVGIVPMHTWLPDAHSQAPTPICALLSGVEVTTILYVIMRLWPVFQDVPGLFATRWLLVLGLISVGVAAFLLIQVHDFKRLFAFSTIEHMGILLTALGLGPAGNYATAYQLLTHGLAKSVAFYAAGSVLLATGSRDISSIRGLIRISPVAGVTLLFSGLAVAGAPPFAVFLSEFSIFRAAMSVNQYWVLGLLLFFLAVAFLGIMLHVNKMVFGQPSHPPSSTPGSLKVAMVVGWIPLIVLGLYVPASLHHLLVLATHALRR